MPGLTTVNSSKGGFHRICARDAIKLLRLYKPYTPPLLRLPNEILAHILDITVSISSNVEDVTRVPITLSQISSRLRRIARSTGSLWTKVVFAFPFDSEDLISLAIRLSLSKGCPIDVYLDLRDPDWDWEFQTEDDHEMTVDDMQVLLTVLLPHAHRFKSFELLCDTWAPVHAFLSRVQSVIALPLLETLRLARCNAYFSQKGQIFEPENLRAPLPLFGSASFPRLMRMSLSGVHVDWRSLSLTGLTSLELKFHAADVMPSATEFADLLSGCAMTLTSLKLLGWGPQFNKEDGSPEPIALPHVTQLHIGFLDAAYTKLLLSTLEIPKLSSLYLEDLSPVISPDDRPDTSVLFDNETRPHDTSTTFQNINLSSLTSFTLHATIIRHSVIQHFLSHLTALTELNLISVENTLFRSLLPFGTSSACNLPCPALETISCRSVDVISLAGIVGLRKSMDPNLPLHQLIFSVRETGWSAVKPIQKGLANLGVAFDIVPA